MTKPKPPRHISTLPSTGSTKRLYAARVGHLLSEDTDLEGMRLATTRAVHDQFQ